MFQNYFKSALRNLRKNKNSALLNILGLVTGMTVFLLIALYVRFEKSYELFIPNAPDIYRVGLEVFKNNELVTASAENYPGVGPALKQELPEVLDFARLYNLGYKNNVIITNEAAQPQPIAFKHRRFLYADSSFLSMMGYPMLQGDPKTALAEPLNAVISASYARRYFGGEDPIGKHLQMQDDDFNRELVTVTGVFKDLPANTHLKFDVLFSYKTLYGRNDRAPVRYGQSWTRKDMYTFIRVRPGTDAKALEAKLAGVVDKYSPNLRERNQKDVLRLQAMRDIHLYANLAEEPEPNGNARSVVFMGLIGLFVLCIAWINYVNLSTARAMERAKEVGVRKTAGAFQSQLVSQFLMETLMVNTISVLLAWVFTILTLPAFNAVSGLSLGYGLALQPWFLGLLVGLLLAGTLFSGFYPAWVLSSFKPVLVLKGKLRHSSKGILLRKGLVVAQFMASVGLIAGVLIVYRQLHYLTHRDLGLNIEQVLVVERPGIAQRDRNAFNSAIDVFHQELRQHPAIEASTAAATVPGKQREYKQAAKRYGAPDAESAILRFNSMDYHFLDVFKMKVVAGRMFSPDFPKDRDTSGIITESAAKLLGFKNPEDAIGQTIAIPGFQWNPIVVGVVNDYHQVSLKKALDPTFFYCNPYQGEFYAIRIRTQDRLPETVEHVRQAWAKAFPGNPFDYFFLDEFFNRQYEQEQKFGTLFSVFALLALLIGCLGLLGLSAYTVAQRNKEIGIRKVLGASVASVTGLLAKDFLQLVLIAIFVAVPLTWYAMHHWLQDFAYRIAMPWWVFLIAGAAAVVVAGLTVSVQSIKAALANPVEGLKD